MEYEEFVSHVCCSDPCAGRARADPALRLALQENRTINTLSSAKKKEKQQLIFPAWVHVLRPSKAGAMGVANEDEGA